MEAALPFRVYSTSHHHQPQFRRTATGHAPMQLHARMLKTNYQGCDPTISVANLLNFSELYPSAYLHHYACSIINSVLSTDTVLANTMIRLYARSDNPEQALFFFIELQLHDHAADHFTYSLLLSACTRLQALLQGQQIHAVAVKAGLHTDLYILNSLIHMYSTCNHLDRAEKVFERMPERDVVSWTSIINGTVYGNRPMQALQLFDSMLVNGITPNDATFVSVLRACADVGALSVGRQVHLMAKQMQLDSKANVATALIDTYSKCGCIDDAEQLFEEMPKRDVFAWTAMISGLADHGRCTEALDLFERMIGHGIEPEERTMTAVLCACRSAGWARKGYRYYNSMHKYGVEPSIQHYGCMVDLLARGGHLNEAEGFIRRMPIKPDVVLWRTLVWASKLHGDADRAVRLMNEWELLEMDANNSGSYVLMGNVHAYTGRWEDKARVRESMSRRRIQKLPGCSWIEVKGMIHKFVAGDSGHPEAGRIYRKWQEVREKLKMEGYCPNVSEVLLDMEGDERAPQLDHHSEKLAVAFGLINTSPGEEIIILKNLRSCEDCHTAMKLISRIYSRKIIIRDRIKFHCFCSGSCSCGDYW